MTPTLSSPVTKVTMSQTERGVTMLLAHIPRQPNATAGCRLWHCDIVTYPGKRGPNHEN